MFAWKEQSYKVLGNRKWHPGKVSTHLMSLQRSRFDHNFLITSTGVRIMNRMQSHKVLSSRQKPNFDFQVPFTSSVVAQSMAFSGNATDTVDSADVSITQNLLRTGEYAYKLTM